MSCSSGVKNLGFRGSFGGTKVNGVLIRINLTQNDIGSLSQCCCCVIGDEFAFRVIFFNEVYFTSIFFAECHHMLVYLMHVVLHNLDRTFVAPVALLPQMLRMLSCLLKIRCGYLVREMGLWNAMCCIHLMLLI